MDVLKDSNPFELRTDEEEAEWYQVYRQQIEERILWRFFSRSEKSESNDSDCQETKYAEDVDDLHNAVQTASIDSAFGLLFHDC